MNSSQLKALHLQVYPQGKWFSTENMRGAGDTMRNFGVRRARVEWLGVLMPGDDAEFDAWELYRRRPVKDHDSGTAAYFSLAGELLHGVREV